MVKGIGPKQFMVGQKSIVVTWISSHLWTHRMLQHKKERLRYENNFTLGIDVGPLPGPMTRREYYPRAARTLAAIRNEEERMTSFFPETSSRATTPTRRKVAIGS